MDSGSHKMAVRLKTEVAIKTEEVNKSDQNSQGRFSAFVKIILKISYNQISKLFVSLLANWP